MTLTRHALVAALGAALVTTTAWSAPHPGSDRGRHAGRTDGSQGGERAHRAPAPKRRGSATGQDRPRRITSPRDTTSGQATSVFSPRDPQSGLPTGQ